MAAKREKYKLKSVLAALLVSTKTFCALYQLKLEHSRCYTFKKIYLKNRDWYFNSITPMSSPYVHITGKLYFSVPLNICIDYFILKSLVTDRATKTPWHMHKNLIFVTLSTGLSYVNIILNIQFIS